MNSHRAPILKLANHRPRPFLQELYGGQDCKSKQQEHDIQIPRSSKD